MVTRTYSALYDRARMTMLGDLEEHGITDRCVLAAMSVVPREWFPSPLDAYRLARALQDVQLDPSDTVLEIGTGSGYSAAVMSQLAHHVYTVERDPDVAKRARERLAMLGFDGIDVLTSTPLMRVPCDVVVSYRHGIPTARRVRSSVLSMYS